MVRYQFSADVNAYLEMLRPHTKESTFKDRARKLRLISKNVTRLYEEGKMSSNNARKLTSEDLVAYVGFRRSMGISDSTISKDLCILNQLFLWLGNRSVEEFRLFGGVFKPHAYTGRKDPIPNEVIERVIDLARRTDDWNILRGCVAVLLCTSCGLRSQEARQLYADDVSFMDGHMIVHVVHVKGEGRYAEPRSVLLMDGVEDIVQRYLGARARKLAERGRESRSMFPPLNNSNEFYTQQGFCRMKACVEKELGVRFQLRAGRRAFGQRLLDSGNRIEDVSVAMGHSSTKTTEGYYARNSENQVIKRILRNQTNNHR